MTQSVRYHEKQNNEAVFEGDKGRLYVKHEGGHIVYGKNVNSLSLLERIFQVFKSKDYAVISRTVDGQTSHYYVHIKKMEHIHEDAEIGSSETLSTFFGLAQDTQIAAFLVLLSAVQRDRTIGSNEKTELIEELKTLPEPDSFKMIKIGHNVKEKKKRYVAQKDSEGKITLYALKKVAAGSFTHVFKATDVVSHKKRAVKKARNKSEQGLRWKDNADDVSLKSLQNEHEKLQTIHTQLEEGGKSRDALAKKPVSQLVGRTYIAKWYDGDLRISRLWELSPFRKIPMEKKRSFIVGLFEILKNKHELNYSHLDIKPENFLFKKDKKGGGIKSVVLSDFGGVEHTRKEDAPMTRTEAYTPSDSVRYTGDWSEKRLQAWDIFSMSKSAIEMLLDEKIPNQLMTDRLQIDALVRRLVSAGVPEKAAQVLVSGMNREGQRPPIGRILKILQTAW